MLKFIFRVFAVFLLLLTTACNSSDPGALEGTWKLNGIIPMVVTFRSGETEALGIIEKVSYETEGNTILVTYENGLMEGSSMRYTVVNSNTVKTELGILKKFK